LGATPDGKALLATVDELGQGALYRVDPKTAVPVRLVASGTVEAFSAGRERVVYALASLAGPVDLYSVALRGGRAERLTDANRELLAARRSPTRSGATGEASPSSICRRGSPRRSRNIRGSMASAPARSGLPTAAS